MTDWQPFQTGAPPLDRAIQARYWTLAKHARQAVCEGVAHPLGTEVTVSVNGELLRGEVARTPDQARTLASQWCAAFIDKAWNPSGPDRAPAGAVRWTLNRRGLDVLCESVPRAAGGFDLVLSLRGLSLLLGRAAGCQIQSADGVQGRTRPALDSRTREASL